MKRPTPRKAGDTTAIYLIVKDWGKKQPQGCRTIKLARGMRRPERGRRERGFLLSDPQGVEWIKAGLGTSVTVSRMTDAYGASTLRVPHGLSGSSDSSDLSDLSDLSDPGRASPRRIYRPGEEGE